jgi:CRP-like cAMP-binding protein
MFMTASLEHTINGETNRKWVSRIGHALRNLDDRSVLNRSPLVRITCVERIARERYGNHILPKGLALREVLVECVEKVVNDLSDEPALSRVCRYLVLLKKGLSCKQISAELGLSREHVSRIYRRRALEIVATEFISTVKHKQSISMHS